MDMADVHACLCKAGCDVTTVPSHLKSRPLTPKFLSLSKPLYRVVIIIIGNTMANRYPFFRLNKLVKRPSKNAMLCDSFHAMGTSSSSSDFHNNMFRLPQTNPPRKVWPWLFSCGCGDQMQKRCFLSVLTLFKLIFGMTAWCISATYGSQ